MEEIKAGYLYVMNHGTDPNLVKIGFSNNPTRRIGELHRNSSSPKKMDFDIIWSVSDMRLAEKLAHGRMVDHRVENNREFFFIVIPGSKLDEGYILPNQNEVYKSALWECIEEDFDYYINQQEAGVFNDRDCFKYQRLDLREFYERSHESRWLYGKEGPEGY